MAVIVEKGAPVDETKCQPLTVNIRDFQSYVRSLDPDTGARLLEGLQSNHVLPMIHYIRACNLALRDSTLYETGAEIPFRRAGKNYVFYGHRYGYRVEEA